MMSDAEEQAGRPPIEEVSVQQVAELLRAGKPGGVRLLDVREAFERDIATIEGTEHLDEALGKELLERGNRTSRCIFICHHGVRSLSAAAYFADNGFKNVASMAGGTDAWSREIDSDLPTY